MHADIQIMKPITFVGTAILALVPVPCSAQSGGSFDLRRSAIASGGGRTGGNFVLSGAVGQPGAGTVSGGNFSLAGGIFGANAVPIVLPNDIQGTVHFSNTNAAILSILGPPGNQGFTNLNVRADARPPAPPLVQQRLYSSTASPTSQPYNLTVSSSAGGAQYDVSATSWLDSKKEQYNFQPVTSTLVDTNTGANVDLTECIALLDIRFLDSAGAPVAINGGHIDVHPAASPATLSAVATTMDTGATQNYLAVHADMTNTVDVYFQIGSDPASNQITYHQQFTLSAPCDQIVTLNCVVPPAASLGQIIGNVAMLGEFEVTTADYGPAHPGYTHVTADNGPAQNSRFARLPGTNFTAPSQGAFVLPNLLPSDSQSPPQGYTVYAEMAFRTNYQFEWFRTPFLGYRGNGAFYVPSGSTIDLGNTFVINPGYINGRVFLKGPDESTGPSGLRTILRPPDYDFDHDDGLPDDTVLRILDNGNYWSWISVTGVERLANGATKNAGGGLATVGFDGGFDAASASFQGNYEAVVGGLSGEPSIWTPNQLELRFGPGASPYNPAPNFLYIQDYLAPEIGVGPNRHYTNNLDYCFSELTVGIRLGSGTFFGPVVQSSVGSFGGTNFEGNAANYIVDVNFSLGTPSDQAHAANQGSIVLYLPQGTYNLFPWVNAVAPDGGYSYTQLLPISGLSVGCGQHIYVEQGGPQISLYAPSSAAQSPVAITGSVAGSNGVALITYSLNGGPANIVCTNCGFNPSFSLNAALVNPSPNSLAVTAYDSQGKMASVTSQIIFTPPRPALQVANGPSGTITVSWDRNFAGFALQQTPDIDVHPTPWTPVALSYQTNATFIYVTLPISATRQFYRLQK
jgi:hypothetical protein